jgi:uncharacterized protein (TIGR02145 family)
MEGTYLARQGMCATGYHIPTQEEWVGLIIAYARSKGNTTYNGEKVSLRPENLTRAGIVNDLLFPLAGYRYRGSGVLNSQGDYARYRASTPNGTDAYNLFFHSTDLSPQSSNNRTYGFPVRCFKNTPPKPLEGEVSYSTT